MNHTPKDEAMACPSGTIGQAKDFAHASRLGKVTLSIQ